MHDQDATFTDVFNRLKHVVSRLDRQVENILHLESLGDGANVPLDTVDIAVAFDGRTFELPADVFRTTGLTPLVEPMQRAANDAVLRHVDEAASLTNRLYQICFAAGAEPSPSGDEPAPPGDEQVELPGELEPPPAG